MLAAERSPRGSTRSSGPLKDGGSLSFLPPIGAFAPIALRQPSERNPSDHRSNYAMSSGWSDFNARDLLRNAGSRSLATPELDVTASPSTAVRAIFTLERVVGGEGFEPPTSSV